MQVSREELFEEVWAEPMLKVAAKYGVSSSFLARVCDRLGVPKPARGYWAKLAAEKAPPRPMLPEPSADDELTWTRGRELEPPTRTLPRPPPTKRQIATRAAVERPSQHLLLLGAREHFVSGRTSRHGYLRPNKQLLVDLFVSESVLDRALSLANELFLALGDRGYEVAFAPRDQRYARPGVDERSEGGPERYNYDRQTWSPIRPTIVAVGTVAIGLTVFELSESIEVKYVDGEYVPVSKLRPPPKRRTRPEAYSYTTTRDLPSGRLCVRASSPYSRVEWEKQWRESRPGEIESLVPRIVRTLESEAVSIANMVEEAERKAEIERKEWEEENRRFQIKWAEQCRVENLEKSRAELLAVINQWSVARGIEAFFEDAERRAHALEPDEKTLLLERLQRAREVVGPVDALARLRQWKAPEER